MLATYSRERGKGDEMTDDDFGQPMGGAAAAACIQKDDRELTQQYTGYFGSRYGGGDLNRFINKGESHIKFHSWSPPLASPPKCTSKL